MASGRTATAMLSPGRRDWLSCALALAQNGAPSPLATLIRRAYFDMLGLPPTPSEVADFVSDQSLGTPPGTLRDRMNDLSSGFVHDVLPLGGANNDRALARIRELLDQGRPVLTLVGWGSQYAADIFSPHDAAATAHWIVVRGYNSRSRTFLIVDNGHAVEWSYEHFASMFDYGQDAQFEALLALMNVEKGSIIYRR